MEFFWIHLKQENDFHNAASNWTVQSSTILKQWSEAMETPVLSHHTAAFMGCQHVLMNNGYA